MEVSAYVESSGAAYMYGNALSNTFSTYKDTLNKCGLLSNRSAYGQVEFSLPFFEEYVGVYS